MSFIRSFLLIAACLVSSQAQADSYFYDFAYRFTDGTVVDGRFMGDVDPDNADRLIYIRQVSAWYTLTGAPRTEFNGSGVLNVGFPNWNPRAYMSFTGKWNDFILSDDSGGGGTTNLFNILGGYEVANFRRYDATGPITIAHDVFNTQVVDPATGTVPGWHLALAAVPEPGPMSLYLLGLSALGLLVHHHRLTQEQ